MPDRVPLTVVIPTLNEGAQIADCLRTTAWADQAIVADAGSTDDTAAAAERAGAKVIRCPGMTIAGQRNAAIAQARNAWVLALDADERVTPELAREIAGVLANPRHQAYAVRRRNHFLGKPIQRAGWGSDWVTRLFRRERRFVERRLHESLEPVADLGRLQKVLDHMPYRDLTHYLEKLDRYSRWAADDLADRGRRPRLRDLVLKPPARFIRMYVVQLGFLDGWRGAVLCGLAAVSVFMRYARLWERTR
ncbi:MAG: glycosyltransferase family 2 protein [Gemmatimonadales bacterium]